MFTFKINQTDRRSSVCIFYTGLDFCLGLCRHFTKQCVSLILSQTIIIFIFSSSPWCFADLNAVCPACRVLDGPTAFVASNGCSMLWRINTDIHPVWFHIFLLSQSSVSPSSLSVTFFVPRTLFVFHQFYPFFLRPILSILSLSSALLCLRSRPHLPKGSHSDYHTERARMAGYALTS